ncbi:hypothetical protein [Mucilaginibacter jinjuensis]|uniref:Uncharacterized protein n=1 Tax=Mucilaginibacter jinjuensis TaxID=1176721 RepID=A0ABY7T8P2_9SPHI|nr:hypothetical protein [Mucilaginibacter jinjuensis]WCT12490.1 hypothetical protein PQO05_00915 [Mucilaginibacter jinjuensis]
MKKSEEQKTAIKKKQWIKPDVETIGADIIASGSVFQNHEGGYYKLFSYNGALIKATYFS